MLLYEDCMRRALSVLLYEGPVCYCMRRALSVLLYEESPVCVIV